MVPLIVGVTFAVASEPAPATAMRPALIVLPSVLARAAVAAPARTPIEPLAVSVELLTFASLRRVRLTVDDGFTVKAKERIPKEAAIALTVACFALANAVLTM